MSEYFAAVIVGLLVTGNMMLLNAWPFLKKLDFYGMYRHSMFLYFLTLATIGLDLGYLAALLVEFL